MYSRLKTKEVARVSVQNFLWHYPAVYYWTFTVHEVLEDKEEAMRRAKPLFDLIGRKRARAYRAWNGGDLTAPGTYLAFWELQKRGSWHLHLLTNVWLDVKLLRPWMVERGWGQQMRGEFVRVAHAARAEAGKMCVLGPGSSSGASRLARYLIKYLTKSVDDVSRKKPFSCSQAERGGTIGFQWVPDINPTAYFYYWGRQLYIELHGTAPRFDQFKEVCRLGYEASDWASIDFLYVPP